MLCAQIDVELQMLEGMGFKDAKRNREALMKADGVPLFADWDTALC